LSTRQADSEVLLIENDIILYRASDRLYQGRIAEGSITETRMIVQDEIIRDVHWAFMK